MKRLAIVGASGHGSVVADAAENCGWDVFFFDDNKSLGGKFRSWPISGCVDDLLSEFSEYEGVIVGIGDNSTRIKISNALKMAGAELVTIIHPSATISKYSQIGEGSVVMAGGIINAYSRIGRVCIVNTAATIDHDCIIGDGVHISPGANLAGEVTVRDGAWVGIGSSVRQGIRIGKNSIVAAGSVIVKDVESDTVVAGVPAKILR